MNSSTIPDAIEKLLDTKFESCETPGSRWLEKRSENGSLLRIILNSDAGSLDFSYGLPMAPGQECEIRFHLEGATVIAFGDSLRLVEQSGFTVHLVCQEGRLSVFAWLPPDR
ncbi:MAG TPA: hypothetical protein VHM91_07415 [Verrucomicrobiales bacterium]|nr:hypothetical protein [Verrucomicrobiales bacterium]